MSARIDYKSGPITLCDLGTPGVRPSIDIHIQSRNVKTKSYYWPERDDRPGVGRYISLSSGCDSGEVNTFMSIPQAVAMRDALSAVLSEADLADREASAEVKP